jgi:hypothetical protein
MRHSGVADVILATIGLLEVLLPLMLVIHVECPIANLVPPSRNALVVFQVTI